MLNIETEGQECKIAYMTISERIKYAREKAKLSQRQLAIKMGISASAVSQWESLDPDKNTQPDAGNLLKCAQICSVDPHWLQFGGPKLDISMKIDGNTPLLRNFPFLRISEIEKWMYNPVLNQEYRIIQMPMMDENVSDKAFLFEVIGSAMVNTQNPMNSVLPGELALVDPKVIPKSGQLVLVKFAENDIRIRQYQEDGAKKFFKAFENHLPIEILSEGTTILGTIIKAGSWRNLL